MILQEARPSFARKDGLFFVAFSQKPERRTLDFVNIYNLPT